MDDATVEADGDSDNGNNNDGDGRDAGTEVETNGVTARYRETDAERLLEFDADGATAVVSQNREGYAMLTVRRSATGNELERYYGFDMALDHAAELLSVNSYDLPIPPQADDMGM